MWFFSSPLVVFGEGALSYLEQLSGRKAFIVTDETLARLGFAERVAKVLAPRMQVEVFTAVEPDPSLDTTRRGAQAMLAFSPDWIFALGGGSVIDARTSRSRRMAPLSASRPIRSTASLVGTSTRASQSRSTSNSATSAGRSR